MMIGSAKRGALRVLLVDDDEDYAVFVKHLLMRLGRVERLDIHSDLKGAVDAMGQASYDLVVSDYNLGVGNGGKILEEARVRLPRARRILLTSSPDRAQRELQAAGITPHAVWDKRWDTPAIVAELLKIVRAFGSSTS
jgi:CheY-like chemotaxis protein